MCRQQLRLQSAAVSHCNMSAIRVSTRAEPPNLTDLSEDAGLLLGVLIQSGCYMVLLSRMDWTRLAATVAAAHQPSSPPGQQPA